MDEHYATAAARLPRPAGADEISPEERDDYLVALAKVEKYSAGNAVASARPVVDGQPYALPYFAAWTNSPTVGIRLSAVAQPIVAAEGVPGRVRPIDHEIAYFVIDCDSGYWAYHAGHTSNALSVGVRLEALEALSNNREELLTPGEREQVEFVRAVRDGLMTDELWGRMVQRLGSVRGVMELAALVCILFTTHRLMWAFGCPAMSRGDWNRLAQEYKDGRDPAAATQDYVAGVLERAAQSG